MLSDLYTFGPWTWDGDAVPFYLIGFAVAWYLAYEAATIAAGWWRRWKHPDEPKLFGEQRGFAVTKKNDQPR